MCHPNGLVWSVASHVSKVCLQLISLLTRDFAGFRWNSAVFSATPVSWYRVAMVTSDFESDPNPWTNNSWTGDMTPNIQQMRNNISGLDRLNKTECFDRYISGSVGMGDLIVVSSNVSSSPLGADDVDALTLRPRLPWLIINPLSTKTLQHRCST